MFDSFFHINIDFQVLDLTFGIIQMAFGNKENSKKWFQRVLIISWQPNLDLWFSQKPPIVPKDDLPDKSNPLFRHKDVTDHTPHLSVMHIFYNIHIHPRIFQFQVYTVEDLSFVQLKRLLGNRTVDMWLDIGHHFLICIALPERYFKILNGYTSVRILFLERGSSYEIYFWFNPDPGQVKLKF